MHNQPNVVMRGGPADGQLAHVPVLGDPVPGEDVRGRSITALASEHVADGEGVALLVYVPKA